MLKAIWSYVLHEIAVRYREILGGGELWCAGVVGVAVALGIGRLPFANVDVKDVVVVVLTYASIALGFCVAGMTIALTLPHEGFAKKLASTKLEGKPGNGFSDLMFVFSWTAISHWLCIVVLCIVTVLSQRNDIVYSAAYVDARRVFVGCVAGLVAYCLGQFLITLITLSQVARVLVKHYAGTK